MVMTKRTNPLLQILGVVRGCSKGQYKVETVTRGDVLLDLEEFDYEPAIWDEVVLYSVEGPNGRSFRAMKA